MTVGLATYFAVPPPWPMSLSSLFFFNATATTEIYTLSLHDALPILLPPTWKRAGASMRAAGRLHSMTAAMPIRSEEHTSELQSHHDLVCRLLLEKKKNNKQTEHIHETHKSVHSALSTLHKRNNYNTP